MSAGNVRVTSNVEAVVAAAVKGAEVGVTAWGLMVETDGKLLSPVKTGTNRRSINTQVKTEDKKITAQIGPGTDYGGYLELGTRHMAARPYMRPASDMHRVDGPQAVRDNVRAAVKGDL